MAVAALVVALASAGGAGSWGSPGGDTLAGLALQPDGKIVLVGSKDQAHVLLERFDVDGRLDASFGAFGRVVTDEPTEWASSVAIDADGRIVIAAATHVLRYHSDGQLDESFGNQGVAPVGGGQLAALALQPDGMIVVAGRSSDSPTRFLLVRLRADGTQDPGFGSNGVVTTAYYHDADVRALTLQPDGRLLAVGTILQPPEEVPPFGRQTLALARYLPDGRLDPSFGTGGQVTTEACGDHFEGNALALNTDDRITAAGTALVRYLPNGSLDPSFAGGAAVPLGIYGRGLALFPDGGAIVAGSDGILRFRADGTLDPAFGVDGAVRTGLSIAAGVVDSAGRIVVGGSTGDWRATSIWLKRYLPNGDADRAFVAGQGAGSVEELRALSTASGRLRTLLRGERIASPALSPDRRRLAFLRSVHGRLELDVVGVDGHGLRSLLVNPFLGHELTTDTALSWAPNGRRIALDAWPVRFPATCAGGMPKGTIYVVEVADRHLRRLTTGTGPAWSPDGRRLAFGYNQKLFVSSVDGSGRHAIAAGTKPPFSWSPHGRRIAFVEAQRGWIAIVDRDGRGKRRLALGRAPAWSPSGKQIAYQRNDCPSDRGYDCLRVVRSGGGDLRRLARFRGGALSPLSWSGDGSRIALPVWPRPSPPDPPAQRPWQIAVVSVVSGKVRLYTVGAAPVMPLAPTHWGAGGRTLLVVLRNVPASGLQ